MMLRGRGRVSDETAALLRGERREPPNQRRPLHVDGLPSYSSLCDTMKATVTTQQTDAIVAGFDLAGFTSFCSQVDPLTDIPNFLNSFLEWLFGKIEQANATGNGTARDPLWQEQPFFAKFLGDGILLLWDAGNMADRQIGKLVTLLLDICNMYRNEFISKVSQSVKGPPQSLRCRVGRGSVFSVNNGRDYVGHCINVTVHLHDYKMFSFGIVNNGFNGGQFLEADVEPQLQLISLPTRGIKTSLPVWVLRRELNSVRARLASR